MRIYQNHPYQFIGPQQFLHYFQPGMNIRLDFNVLLYFAGISIGLYTSLLLFFSKRNRPANRILALLLLAIVGWITDAIFRASGIYAQHPNLYFLPIYYSFAFGPLIYLYVVALTDKDFRMSPKRWIHFVPVAIQAAFYWIMCFQSYQVKYHVWFRIHQPYTYRIEYDGTWLSLVSYLSLAIYHFRKYRSWIEDQYSDLSKKLLTWLRFSLFALILVCITWLFEAILRDFQGTYYLYDFSTNLLCLVICCMGILGMQQSNLGVQFRNDKEESPVLPLAAPTPEANPEVIARIQHSMAIDKMYLNPELTLAELARSTGHPAKTVSSAISTAFGKSFNSYVNGYRVEEVKSRLLSADLGKFTLLGIAFESGFNSKTSFNRIFKDATGSSPSEFLKK